MRQSILVFADPFRFRGWLWWTENAGVDGRGYQRDAESRDDKVES